MRILLTAPLITVPEVLHGALSETDVAAIQIQQFKESLRNTLTADFLVMRVQSAQVTFWRPRRFTISLTWCRVCNFATNVSLQSWRKSASSRCSTTHLSVLRTLTTPTKQIHYNNKATLQIHNKKTGNVCMYV